MWDEWVAPIRLKPLALTVGAKIKVQYMKDKRWYSAKIVSIQGDKVAVDYDDDDDSWNETVGRERIQLP